jgi:hypothetical protein
MLEQSNNTLQRASDQRGRPVLAMDCALAEADWASCLAAERDR